LNRHGLIAQYLAAVAAVIPLLPQEQIARVVEAIEDARRLGRKIMVFGNGGSSSTATHFASDLAKGAISRGKKRIRAICLNDNTALLTAWANDTAYDQVFAEQLENLAELGDLVIAISGSGNSPNILSGIRKAKEKGARTIGFAAFDGGQLKDMVDIALVVPCHNMRQAEDLHLILEHVITACLSQEQS